MSSSDFQQQIEYYNALLERYKELDTRIRALLADRHSAHVHPDAILAYRQLARERDEIASEMRSLEHLLSVDE